jgi:hypothetical protein
MIRALINSKKSKISTYISNLLSQAFRLKYHFASDILNILFFQDFRLLFTPYSTISYDVPLKIFALNLSFITEIERISIIIYDNFDQRFFVNLNTIIRALISY